MVKTTINRLTLHLVAGEDYPAYAQLTRQARMRAWRKRHAGLDEERVAAELGDWLREPRTNAEIRERVRPLRGRDRRALGADRLRPHAAAAGAAAAGGSWGDRGAPAS